MSARFSIDNLTELAARALEASKVSADNARIVAEALVAAEADGLPSHGVSRIPFYAEQAKSGKVDGYAVPSVRLAASAAVLVDARYGFAFPAMRAGLDKAAGITREIGVTATVVTHSHHAGALSHPVERAAQNGLVALAFSNTPSGIAPWGGHKGSLGTNPIAFACPRKSSPPLVVDLSLSKVARGKIMLAAKAGKRIPEGWALNKDGKPTTDAEAALEGTMLPIGDAKGAGLALMVEILSAGLARANFAFQASSFFDAKGAPPGIGQSFILIDPAPFAGDGFADHVERLVADILSQDGARLPGDRRLASRELARNSGVEISEALVEDLRRRSASA
ncbi:MAG TPA: Ldh family oxidoreductase [Gammaproteobacteria bacterium]|nr:Ldh family oxidoreductase [Gammaproteobacteria bacterium]